MSLLAGAGLPYRPERVLKQLKPVLCCLLPFAYFKRSIDNKPPSLTVNCYLILYAILFRGLNIQHFL